MRGPVLGHDPADHVDIRLARRDDVPALVALFAADDLGGHGDTTDPAALPDYLSAFDRIAASPNDRLFVAEVDGMVAATFQVSFMTALTGRGSVNMTIEAVQTCADMRGRGIGAAMIRFAVELARHNDVRLVQLMSNATRTDAHRFYERLGFAKSHAGFKMKLK